MKSALYAAFALCAILGAPRQAIAAADHLNIANTGKGSASNWPIYIARDEGFFAANDLTVDLIATRSTANVIQQLVAGAVEIGTGGISDPIRAIDQGAPLSLLRVETLKPPFSLWGKSSIHNIKELRHKLVMVGGAKDITRIYLQRMMVPNGLKDGDYDLVYAGTTPARLAALSSGAVDAALLLPPFSFKAQDSGLSSLGDLGDYVNDLPFTGYAVRTDWAKAHKRVVMAFLKGVTKGVAWFYDPANHEAAVKILMKQSGSNQKDVERTYTYYNKIKVFDRKGVVTATELKGLTSAMKALHNLDGSTNFQRFVDPEVAAMVAQSE